MATQLQRSSGRASAHALSASERPMALLRLARQARRNLLLYEMADSVGSSPPPSEATVHLLGAWRGDDLVGLASLRPSVVLDAEVDAEVLAVFMPYLADLSGGLLKSPEPMASVLWERLRERGRRSVVDRIETAYALERGIVGPPDPPPGVVLRRAGAGDLDALVIAARASLREEGRPDPFGGEAAGFRRWVRGRLSRARVVEADARVVWAGYADVRRPEGWLIQGVYTWPEQRRRGFARLGVQGIVQEAFAAGADHLQLAVVDGNRPAIGLYRKLGFQPFEKLRTILFT